MRNQKSRVGTRRVRISEKEVNGWNIETRVKPFIDANIIVVEVGTNGYREGDTGHGCRTYFSIRDDGGTDLSCSISDGRKQADMSRCEEIIITLGGGAELLTFIEALKFAVETLEWQMEKNKGKSEHFCTNKRLSELKKT